MCKAVARAPYTTFPIVGLCLRSVLKVPNSKKDGAQKACTHHSKALVESQRHVVCTENYVMSGQYNNCSKKCLYGPFSARFSALRHGEHSQITVLSYDRFIKVLKLFGSCQSTIICILHVQKCKFSKLNELNLTYHNFYTLEGFTTKIYHNVYTL